MASNIIQELVELFMGFPGIGPRQARRFVEYLVRQPAGKLGRLNQAIERLQKDTRHCERCQHWFVVNGQPTANGTWLCSICRDPNRDGTTMLAVEKDVDLENLERAGDYKGRYFVLNLPAGLIKVDQLKTSTPFSKLLAAIEAAKREHGLQEVVLALPATEEGGYLTGILRELLLPAIKEHDLKLSTLGRGLATGLELEYSDAETLHHALKNRSTLL